MTLGTAMVLVIVAVVIIGALAAGVGGRKIQRERRMDDARQLQADADSEAANN